MNKAYPCPICRRNGWITRAGIESHLIEDHSQGVVAAELLKLVYPPQPSPTSTPPAATARPTCTKVAYPDEPEALRALLSTWQAHGPRRCERRAYHCDRCGKWHLTKQPERTPAP